MAGMRVELKGRYIALPVHFELRFTAGQDLDLVLKELIVPWR